jgi:flagellar basal body L-ring protein FlgH
MMRHGSRWLLVLAIVAAAILVNAVGSASAQTDSLATPMERPRGRASWVSDGVDLRPGDIVTVLIDEQTAAEEWVSESGSDKRTLRAELMMKSDGTLSPGATGPSSQYNADSKQSGQAGRQGGITGVLSTRVTSVDANGLASIEGKKSVTVDGRDQVITLKGLVRSQDLSSNNMVYSSRLADAAITYEGKKIKPKMGIIGKILGMLWPF